MKRKCDLRLGIVQGRLTQSPPGQLQWFPQDYWESEFFVASALGLDYIEFIAERNHNSHNPIWSDQGVEKIKNLANRNDLSLHAFCNDYILDHQLLNDSKVLTQNFELIERGSIIGCKKFILPLFEKSELSVENHKLYTPIIRNIADHASSFGLIVCLETNLNGFELNKILEEINHPAVKVVYDTGNRAAFGHDLPGDIRLLNDKISHIHIKDKNNKNENVILGTGLVNFCQIFEALSEIGYCGPYTFETNRGKNALATASYNIDFIRFFHAEAFLR